MDHEEAGDNRQPPAKKVLQAVSNRSGTGETLSVETTQDKHN